jgi:hypothetical protein
MRPEHIADVCSAFIPPPPLRGALDTARRDTRAHPSFARCDRAHSVCVICVFAPGVHAGVIAALYVPVN